jgi:hypothetical protein
VKWYISVESGDQSQPRQHSETLALKKCSVLSRMNGLFF